MKKKAFTLVQLLVAILIIALLMFGVLKCLLWVKENADQIICDANLKRLGNAIQLYNNDYNGRYPTADKWCDLLIEHSSIDAKHFFCRFSGDDPSYRTREPIEEANLSPNMLFLGDYNNYEGHRYYKYWIKVAHYAINPNCEPNSPANVVLLFETKSGWNQFGGPELLTMENHNGEGCNVLFNNGRRRFVKPEKLDKLNWGDDQKQ